MAPEQFTKGRKSQLSALTASTDIYVGIRLMAPGMTWDVSCFCLDNNDRLASDDYFVFYNQPTSPDKAVTKIDPMPGDGDGFRVAVDAVQATIGRLSFCAALDGAGMANQLQSGYLRIVAGGVEVMRYAFTGADFGTERAIMIADLYRKGVWRVGAVGQGFAGGLADLIRSFGGTVDDAPAPTVPMPGMPPAPPPPAMAPPAWPRLRPASRPASRPDGCDAVGPVRAVHATGPTSDGPALCRTTSDGCRCRECPRRVRAGNLSVCSPARWSA